MYKIMNTITIEGQLRSETGKNTARLLRSEDLVPGVIYGGPNTVHFTASQKSLKGLVYTSQFQLAEVKIDGKTYKCILKDMQFHKTTDALMHVDLLELVEGKKLLADIPVNFTGTSIGVKNGGRFIPKVKTVKVKCLPKDLVEALEVNISNLEIGKNLRISDIKGEGIEIMQNERIPIASVVTTRALKQAETEAKKK
jgi:large subunit ribosomal protein L25